MALTSQKPHTQMHKTNFLQEKLMAGKTVVGTWSVIPNPTVSNILAQAGLDFIIIDGEHGPIGLETAQNMIRACELEGCSPLFRVGDNNENLILRALEIGSHGVVIPQILNKREAKSAARAVKYHPAGHRGYSPFTRAGSFSPVNDHAEISNNNTMTMFIVEGEEGISNLDEILEVDNIDVIYIGPYDLSQSVGCPGDITNPKVLSLMRECCKKIIDKGIVAGSFVKDSEYAKMLIDNGVNFLAYRADCDIILNSTKSIINDIAKICNK